ncbi:hypothetical protein [Clostridium niameyense]|uniref:hypothetical protein n=1 Tax=Clostridium niameyense TaxID=1622073 RepID=UPI00067F1E96|nr:hypothetical protein [Clostridium niameyense]
MKKRIFIEGKNPMERAYIGWQDKELSLYGVKEGYKLSADELVNIALQKGKENRIDVLDQYIFPIMHSYRHSIEISLKLIYYRIYGKLPNNGGGHNLVDIWNNRIVGDAFKGLNLDIPKDELEEIRNLLIELIGEDLNELNGKDSKADVWRYLMNTQGNLYFIKWKFIDYVNLKKTMNYLYNQLDAIYLMVDHVLSE